MLVTVAFKVEDSPQPINSGRQEPPKSCPRYRSETDVLSLPMESSSSSSSLSPYSISYWDYLNLYLLRPFLAIAFVLSLISLGWVLAWKLVLVHVPLVQEIFGLRKKPVKPKPPNRHRLTQFYRRINAHNSASETIATD